MRLARLRLRDFRSYERAEVELGDGLTVVSGPNGAGKTNLLEAAYFALTARSPRTANERELVRRGASVTRVEADIEGGEDPHALEVAFTPGEPKRVRVDGAAVEGASPQTRPAVVVFLPDRLELIKGAPSLRRSHLDQLVAALWPARAATRSAYSRALAQRNALVARIRAGGASPDGLDAWDAELARRGRRADVRPPRGRRRAGAGLREHGARARAARSRPSWPTALARAPPTPRGWPPSSPSAAPRTWSAASPRTGPHRDDVALEPRRPVAALLRLAGPAAHGPAGAAVRRARAAGRAPRHAAAGPAGRRHVGAGRGPPRATGRATARRRPGGAHRHRARARPRRRRTSRSRASRSPPDRSTRRPGRRA